MKIRLRPALTTSLLCAAIALIAAAPASAETVLQRTATASGSIDGGCAERVRSGAGTFSESFTSPSLGFLHATLSGGSGDWDLAVFNSDNGEVVAAGATSLADEVAGGFAFAGENLTVQACALDGATGTPQLDVEVIAVSGESTPAPSLLRVSTPTAAEKVQLQSTGLDITHSAGEDFIDIVAYGARDRAALARAGLAYSTRIKDLSAQSAQQRTAERAAPATQASADGTTFAAPNGLPSGRTGTYRRLFDYQEELKTLAEENPKLVRLFTLPEKTYEGRAVQGIEITRNPGAKNGKPVFVNMGIHHAREWPSGEHAIEWAYELINGFKAGDKRATRLVRKTRNVVIPIVNPDGFNASREAGELGAAAAGRGGDETVNIVSHPNEYRRKNCRLLDDSEEGNCAQPAVGLAEPGVDPNRNYGGFWGGPGASTDPTALDYRGPGPFSEPETRNIQSYISRHQVTAFITNHTFTGLVLRPPGIASQGPPPDEKAYRKLGAAMTAHNGYINQPSYKLYDTTGGTEDWAYYATGAFGFTFEIGPDNFHPPYDETIGEWTGNSAFEGADGGNREAYYEIARFAGQKKHHALLKGKGPRKGKLVLTKTFKTKTSPVIDESGEEGEILTFQDKLRTVARVRRKGTFKFHVNPSTRPVVAEDRGVKNPGPQSDPITFTGDPSTTTPCADADTEDETCWNDHPIVIPDNPDEDNGDAAMRVEWSTPASDWDVKVFVDSDGDGSSVGETEIVGASATGNTSSEQVSLADLEPGGKYVVRMVNYAAVEPYEGIITFLAPEPFQAARKERWTLTCKDADGKTIGKRKLYLERGDVKKMDLSKGC
jgi:hypothetical protein